MSGHSKWSTIKRKKGAQDAKRGKIFGRLSKEVSVAAREGGNRDPSSNPRLRLALQNARAANMPKDNIERALKKGEGQDGSVYQQPVYEGYAPSGVAVYVECMTDNLNRTVAQIRHLFNKYGGSLATSGSLEHLFTRKCFFIIDKPQLDEQEEIVLELIDAGMDDVLVRDERSLIVAPFDVFGNLQKKIEALGLPIAESGLRQVPRTMVDLEKKEVQKVFTLLDALEEEDDVQRFFHNLSCDSCS